MILISRNGNIASDFYQFNQNLCLWRSQPVQSRNRNIPSNHIQDKEEEQAIQHFVVFK